MTTTSNWPVILLCCSAIIGCAASNEDIANGDDALEALAVPHRSERYTTTYWRHTRADDRELWAAAVDYCEDKRADYPNCEAVRHVDMMERMTRLPEERPDTFSLRISPPPARDTTPR
ncbi:MAG: hypothetical protein ACRDUY_02030 [Nitriliruptorales bacterium]